VAQLTAPTLEHSPGTRYAAEGSRVVAYRPVALPGGAGSRDLVHTLWAASANFGLPVFVALVLATPGWHGSQRARALGWGLAILTLTQVITMLVTSAFWQQMPATSPQGQALYLPGHSAGRLAVVAPLYHFLEIMGRGFFSLLAYFGALILVEAGPPRGEATAGRNAPCPCGSGRKFKRCCGARGGR
jgi:hypothetical protein